ncbi:ParB/RepB/Spo0J family partition protein [Streptomyces sp. SID8379]|uniref:ParB/RepB/Spo0J family partition protein n=1 Tax=unclassified Streptomyces TaxID=2593676 RepID=UPI000380E8D3|nr:MULTISPECIES: ParB/RepB/Spo0J family partition protein [unclassified Streptomyces]MYW68830.1 ParB/RepB/Spo0J family partition protein [Streptomyces sp. SID8379]
MGRRTDLSSLLSSEKDAASAAGTAGTATAVKKRPDTRPLTVAVGDLAENPDNPRHELRDLEGLAETLRERGVLQALSVVPAAVFLAAHPHHKEPVGKAPYVVLHGHRRLAAAKMAGMDEVPVLVRDDATRSDEDALIENVQRDDLTELEQAQAIQGLITAYGYSQRQVAARIGKTQGFISQRLSLMKLRDDIQEALADGRVSVEDARRIARLPKDEQELPGPVTAVVPAARKEKRERRKNDYGVIELDSRSTPEEVVEALRRHLAPSALDRIVELLNR